MRDPRYATVTREGAHADLGGRDRWGELTYCLRILDPRGRITVLMGCRFDRPAETLQRIAQVR